MRRIRPIIALMVVFGVWNAAMASDRTGIYAIVDGVTIDSAGEPEETIALRGVFSLAKGRREYTQPVYGQMFFRLTKGKEAACRKEWADFKRIAGSGRCVAFGRRSLPLGRVRKPKKKLDLPDAFTLNIGVRKIRSTSNYAPIKRLVHFPRPRAPHDGATVPAGRVSLVVDNISANDKQAKYFFEIEDKTGKTEASASVKPDGKRTRWTPKMQIKPGEKYTWRAWIVTQIAIRPGGKPKPYKGPVATVQFHGKKPK